MEVVESPPDKRIPMAVAKLKRPKEDRIEELAERIAAEINERAAPCSHQDSRSHAQTAARALPATRDDQEFHR